MLRRYTFGQRSEHHSVMQNSLLDEGVDADIAAIEPELEALTPAAPPPAKKKPKRKPLPPVCRASKSCTTLKANTVPMAASCGESARKSAKIWTTRRAYSPSNGIFAVSGSAMIARR
ncbi:hypothetical protein LY622_01260 [Halomonas sp. M5N1S17]|uniref:IS66 family transposase n=1 Tax=Halomonas alkalisoli TaxID=2907158 RepID=UPI001F32C28D|nr:hypothetical protein [Halomonas alkalisoli]MCE9662059.1 hypothetical protein [Halomonas alkalisoli]